jgi:hypothetical protein
MAHLSSIESEVLDSIVNDYESPGTIVAEVSQALGAAVSEAQIAAALAALTARGLAGAYIYDQALAKYRPVSLPQAAEVWFLATPAGRTANEQSAA